MIDIAIITPSGTKAIRGYTTDVSGLVVHRCTWGNGWCITHDRSGRLIVGGIRTLRDSRNIIKRLGELLSDWTADMYTLRDRLPARFQPQSILEDAERV